MFITEIYFRDQELAQFLGLIYETVSHWWCENEHALIHNSVIIQKLTVHVSVKHVHKHGVWGVQPLVRCGTGEHRPCWVQTWRTRQADWFISG